MTPSELKSLCASVNSGQSMHWERSMRLIIWRNKHGLPDSYDDFTLREKLYAWTGIWLKIPGGPYTGGYVDSDGKPIAPKEHHDQYPPA